MSIKLSTKEIIKMKKGTTNISKVYLGNELIYEFSVPEETIPEGGFVTFINDDGDTITVTPTWNTYDDGGRLQYSFDGDNWIDIEDPEYSHSDSKGLSFDNLTEIKNENGNKIHFRGKNPNDEKRLFKLSDHFGHSDNAWDCPDTTRIEGNLHYLLCDEFGDSEAPTKISDNCFANMFSGCTSLTKIPPIPAADFYESSSMHYFRMFNGCTSLTEVPDFPKNELGRYCYEEMFRNCTSLTEPPKLPSTVLNERCYVGMFQGCTSLTKLTELPAEKVHYGIYVRMFEGCENIKVSKTQTGNYQYEWKLGIDPSEVSDVQTGWVQDMLKDTGGTFTDRPEPGVTYYVKEEPK